MGRALGAMALAVLALTACSKGGSDDNTHLTITYQMAKPCVRVGEEERLVSRTTSGAEIAYAIIYADKKIRGTAPRGHTDGHGRFSASWKVPQDAPPGRVDVRILALKGHATANVVAHFDVGECP
jgi:hypothetical protein